MLSASKVKRLIESLKVSDQATSKLVPFKLYPEQERLLETLVANKKVTVLKSRQIGASTLCLAYCLVFGIVNPGVNIAIVAHNYNTTVKLVQDLKKFLIQLGIKLIQDSRDTIEISNGTKFRTITAGAKTAGRSYTFSLILCSEAAYYQDSMETMAALLATATSNAQIILESTASAIDTHFLHSWTNNNSQFTRFFSSFEDHPNYKSTPDTISDEEFLELQVKFNFTKRESASWWVNKLKEIGDDTTRMLREYPLKSDQAFQSVSGRWVSIDPPVRQYSSHILYPQFHIYENYNHEHRYIVSIDTAAGGGGDFSCFVVYNITTKTIAASFADNETKLDKYSDIIMLAAQIYNPKLLIVETNGIGEGISIMLKQKSLPVFDYTATTTSRYIGFLWARTQITKHGMAADEFLVKNCQSCTVSSNPSGSVKFNGTKDMLAALSFIGANIELIKQEAEKPEPKVYGPDQFNGERLLRNAIKANRRR